MLVHEPKSPQPKSARHHPYAPRFLESAPETGLTGFTLPIMIAALSIAAIVGAAWGLLQAGLGG
jgi:hypothetical protein